MRKAVGLDSLLREDGARTGENARIAATISRLLCAWRIFFVLHPHAGDLSKDREVGLDNQRDIIAMSALN